MIIAYIDPGSGLLVWQATLAVMLGVVFYLRKTRDALIVCARKLFRWKK